MKRVGNLFPLITDTNNLEYAFWKAQRGKSYTKEVMAFRNNLSSNLSALRAEMLDNTLEIGNYHRFVIFDPKQREIVAAPFKQRVLHHALMNVCHATFERCQIFDSYASRKGKGTYAALERAFYFAGKYQWFLKLDFKKYFASISHEILKKQLRRIFKDAALLRLFDSIIDSYNNSPFCGLPIGNLTSQYFANHYLAVADHYAKEVLRCPAYVRYMDDIVMWHNDKQLLLEIGKSFRRFTSETLSLTLKPSCLNRQIKGLPFVGYLVYPTVKKLAQRSKKRFVKKLKQYHYQLDTLAWSAKEYQNHITPLIAFTSHANAKAYRRTVIEKFGEQL